MKQALSGLNDKARAIIPGFGVKLTKKVKYEKVPSLSKNWKELLLMYQPHAHTITCMMCV